MSEDSISKDAAQAEEAATVNAAEVSETSAEPETVANEDGSDASDNVTTVDSEKKAKSKSSPAVAVESNSSVSDSPRSAHVVTPNAMTDTVYLSKCIFKNKYARKSLTVHHLQRRLYELGFKDAYSDKDGWYGDLTAKSVMEYQEVNGFEPTGIVDAATFEDIFTGDAAVTVNVTD
jgi:hypothetical protein